MVAYRLVQVLFLSNTFCHVRTIYNKLTIRAPTSWFGPVQRPVDQTNRSTRSWHGAKQANGISQLDLSQLSEQLNSTGLYVGKNKLNLVKIS